eukprot:1033343-Amphidinium_carterae.1
MRVEIQRMFTVSKTERNIFISTTRCHFDEDHYQCHRLIFNHVRRYLGMHVVKTTLSQTWERSTTPEFALGK